jgi:homoserine dehydrogenase
VLGLEHLETRYYVRVTVNDRPGVLAQIAQTLGDHSVSIAAVSQKEADAGRSDGRTGDHDAPGPEGSMRTALRAIEALAVVNQVSSFLRVEG